MLPLVGLGALISPEDFPRAARNSASTGQHSGALTDWSHPASASGPTVWQEMREIVIDEGPMMPEPAPQSSNLQLPSYLINLQTFSTTQFEGFPIVQTRAMLTAIEEKSYELEERLAPAERPGQLNLSTVAYLQIASELPQRPRCGPQPAKVQHPRLQNVRKALPRGRAIHKATTSIVQRPFGDVSDRFPRLLPHSEPRASSSQTLAIPSLSALALFSQLAKVFKTLQIIAKKFSAASAFSKPLISEPPVAVPQTSLPNVSFASDTILPPPLMSTASVSLASFSATGTNRPISL